MPGLGARLYKADSVLPSESKDVSSSEEQQLEAAVAMSKTAVIGSRQGGRMYGRSHQKHAKAWPSFNHVK